MNDVYSNGNYFLKKMLLVQINVSRFIPEVRIYYYKEFMYNFCGNILSIRTLSHLGVVTFRQSDFA